MDKLDHYRCIIQLTHDLLEAGIPWDDIVLAFYRPDRRSLTELAMV